MTEIKRVYRNPSTNVTISSDKQVLGSAQDLANQGYAPIGTEEKKEDGTLYAGQRDPKTGQRFERFVQTPKPTIEKTSTTQVTPGTQTSDADTRDDGAGAGDGAGEVTGVSQFKLDAPDRGDIRTQKLSDAQSIIDAINENYGRQIRQEEVAGEGREGRTRALNIGAGMAGGNFATAGAIKTEEQNLKIMQSIEAERDAKVQNILNEVRDETDDTYELRRKEYIQQFEDETEANKKFAEDQKTDAMERISNIVKSGVLLSEFKEQHKDVYDKLITNSGLTEIEFDSMANASSQTPVKYSYKELKDGTLLRTGDDGSAEEIGNYAPPSDDANWKIEPMGDGSLYWMQKDEEGNIVDFEKFQSTKKTPGIPSQTTIQKQAYSDAIRQMNVRISTGENEKGNPILGADGKMSPDDYNSAKKAWTDDGYSPGDFDEEFAGFRDPTNPNYAVGGAKAEDIYRKTETGEEKEVDEKTEARDKIVNTYWDKYFGDYIAQAKTREDVEKVFTDKYGSITTEFKGYLDRRF